jgi:two-component system sensor histidine kinase VicK
MFWVRSIFTPIGNVTDNIKKITENGEYTSLIYNKQDEFTPLIFAINNLHKSLSIQEKIRSNFLSDLSHEIRTPITAVKCYLEAIEDGVMKLDAKTIALFKNELDRLTSTTEEIMQFERATHPIEKTIHVERLNIRKLLVPMIQEYLPQSNKRGQTIEIDMPKDPTIRIDQSMFAQIVHNIFSNFIKYSGDHTTLICRYERTPTHIYLIFQDDGIGIPESDIPFVKEKFYRVDTARNR